MGSCHSLKIQFEGTQPDNWERLSNCLLAPLRVGLGYKIWDAKTNSTTQKVASVCMAIFAFTLWLVPTLLGLLAWKISKTLPVSYQKMSAQIQILIPSSNAIPMPQSHCPEINNALAAAEVVFKNFDTASQEEKQKMQHHLGEAYKAFHNEYVKEKGKLSLPLEQQAARIFYLYGILLYGGDMVKAKKLFCLSLALQLGHTLERARVRTFVPKPHLTPCNTLEGLLTLDLGITLSVSHELLTDSSNEELAKMVLTKNTIQQEAFVFAETMFWVGATYQNIDQYKTILPLFEKYFGLPKLLFAKIDTPESRWKVADIIYNTGRHIHLLKHPGDIQGALATLDEVTPYLDAEGQSLRAQVKRAQIHNITAIEWSKKVPQSDTEKKQFLELQYRETLKALKIAESTPQFYSFLKIVFTNNAARIALNCLNAQISVTDIPQIDKWMAIVMKDMEKSNFDHYYHASFVLNAARIEIYKNNKQKAKDLLDHAEVIAKKYPESTKATMEGIAAERKKL